MVTRAEVADLLRPLFGAAKASAETPGGKPEVMEQAQEKLLRDIEQAFGSHAGAVLHQLAVSVSITGADEISFDEGKSDDRTAAEFLVPVQFRLGRAWGAYRPFPILTPQQERDTWRNIQGAANGFLSTVEHNANLAWAMAQIASRVARNAVFNDEPGKEDKPGGIHEPGWPRNTSEPNPYSSEQPGPPPPPPEEKPPDRERAAGGIVGAGIGAEQGKQAPPQADSVGLSSEDRDAFLADPIEQRRVVIDALEYDSQWAMSYIRNQIRKHGLSVMPYSAVAIWHYTRGQEYQWLTSEYAAGRATKDEKN